MAWTGRDKDIALDAAERGGEGQVVHLTVIAAINRIALLI